MKNSSVDAESGVSRIFYLEDKWFFLIGELNHNHD